MQAHCAEMERIATLRTGAEPVRGIMASKSGTRAFRPGGSGLASDNVYPGLDDRNWLHQGFVACNER
jgi:hypothetical protein